MTNTTDTQLDLAAEVMAACGWDADALYCEQGIAPTDLLERVAGALEARDRDGLINAIIGGATWGEAAETASDMLDSYSALRA